MISKGVIAVAAAALAGLPISNSMAAEPSALVAGYYRQRIQDRPSGVYEWDAQDLLFVQVRLPEVQGEASEEMPARILVAEHRELFAWLARSAAKRKAVPDLGYGLNRLREVVRSEDPLFEYDAEWDYRFDGPHFSRREPGERVCCAVYSKREVLRTMPKAFLEPCGAELWLRGGRAIVGERCRSKTDRPLLWNLGALESLTLVLEPETDPSVWAKELGLREGKAEKEKRTLDEKIRNYLTTSETADRMRREKRRRETIPDRISYEALGEDPEPVRNVVQSVVTNRVDGEIFEVTDTVRETRVSRHRLRRVVTKMAEDPLFERLFLSGGSLTNAPMPRTAAGVAAERSFFAKSSESAAVREAKIVAGLQENPGDKVLWNLLARVMMRRGDRLGAVVCLRNALRLDDCYDYALTNLAIVLRQLECRDLALGQAILALGLAGDEWCRKGAAKVISE